MEATENQRDSISIFGAIGVIEDIQTGFIDSFKRANKIYDIKDFRCNIFFSCFDLVTNSRLTLAMLGYSLSTGMLKKEWWLKWGCYHPLSFENIPDFNIYVHDKTGQLLWHTRDTITLNLFIYIEGFIRKIARQKGIESKDLYSIRNSLLKNLLGLAEEEITPLIIFQHLRNSIHNKGIHFNLNYLHAKYKLGQYDYEFKHDEKFFFDWQMLGELLIHMNKLLWKIVNHEQIKQLELVSDKNFIVRHENKD
jgi:hypothetical protein